jgi:uncharacterized protein YcaQ
MPPTTQSIDRATARRFLVRRHLLSPPRSLPAEPASVKTVFDRLGSIQFDPLEVAGRNHDLVLAARIAGYRREWTDALLYEDRWVYETYNKGLSLVPTAELPWHRVTWDRHRKEQERTTFVEHKALVDELLERIRGDGHLSSTDVAPRAAIDWYWRPTNQVRAILEALAQSGILALARREGNRRIYDLTERLFPADLLAERRSPADQGRHRMLSRYRAHGLLGARGGQQEIWIGTDRSAADRNARRAELIEAGEIVPVEVEGVRGTRYVLGSELTELESAARSVARAEPASPGLAFIAPLDPIVWDREVLRSLFDFDYIWEVYVPAAKRRWGYYVLPMVAGDRFVGRIEPRIDRKADALRILDLWWEDAIEPLDEPGLMEGLVDAIEAHARFAGVRRVIWPRTARHRAVGAAVRERLAPGGRVRS